MQFSYFLLVLWNITSYVYIRSQNISHQECFVYRVMAGHVISYPVREGHSFTVGYLRLTKKSAPADTQIHVHIIPKEKGNKPDRYLEIYFTPDKRVVLRDENHRIADSIKPLPDIEYNPSWFNFIVRMQDEELKVFRAGHLAPLVRMGIKKIEAEKFQINIHSRYTEYVTLNCMTRCPIFSTINDRPLSVTLQTSFTINIRSSKASEGEVQSKAYGTFIFGLSSFWFEPFNYTYVVKSETHNEVKIQLTMVEGVGKELNFVVSGNKTIFIGQSNKTKVNFTLTIFESKNVYWAFNCKNFYENELNTADMARRGRSFEDSKSFPQHPHYMTFSVGEVAGWIVASLSLCGLLIVGMTLYSKVSREPGDGADINPISVSHVGNFDMLQYPKPQTSMFYATIKTPDEGSEIMVSTNDLSDLLYPLDLSIGDDRSPSRECTLISSRSKDTAITCVSLEKPSS